MTSSLRLVEPRSAGCTGRGPQRSRALPVVEEEMELIKKQTPFVENADKP